MLEGGGKWLDSYPPPLCQLQPLFFLIIITSRLLSPCVTAEIHKIITMHLVALMAGAGWSKRQWIALTQAEKSLSTLPLFRAHSHTRLCSSLSAMQEFYKRSKSGSKPGVNVRLSVSYCKLVCVCVWGGGGGTVPPTRSAVCLSSCTFHFSQVSTKAGDKTVRWRWLFFCDVVVNIAGYTKSTERKSFILIPLKHSLWARGGMGGLGLLALMSWCTAP